MLFLNSLHTHTQTQTKLHISLRDDKKFAHLKNIHFFFTSTEAKKESIRDHFTVDKE